MLWRRSGAKRAPGMTLEGVLGPNNRLDRAAGLRLPQPGALCIAADGRLLVSSGTSVLALAAWDARPEGWASFEAPVTALAASPAGRVAVGLAGGGLSVRDCDGNAEDGWARPQGLTSVTDCLFLSEAEIALVDCGYGAEDDILSRAPWDEHDGGRVIALGRDGASRPLAQKLHCPMGLCPAGDGALIVTELERARLIDITGGAVRRSGFPGYLGRIRPGPNGYLLACLARRDPLIEFLKTETAFVADMRAAIDPHHWISPRVDPAFSHDFPIELGATRLFGEVKPWAPSFSYGLVIEMNEDMMPIASAHSRADGHRHAITDILSWRGDLIAVSAGSGELLNLGPGSMAA